MNVHSYYAGYDESCQGEYARPPGPCGLPGDPPTGRNKEVSPPEVELQSASERQAAVRIERFGNAAAAGRFAAFLPGRNAL